MEGRRTCFAGEAARNWDAWLESRRKHSSSTGNGPSKVTEMPNGDLRAAVRLWLQVFNDLHGTNSILLTPSDAKELNFVILLFNSNVQLKNKSRDSLASFGTFFKV